MNVLKPLLKSLSRCLVFGGLVGVMAMPAVADDWPQFRGTPEQIGLATGLGTSLQPVWTYSLTDGAETTPAIVDGKVFIGGLSGTFAALDLKTGKELWKIEVEEEIKSSALVHKGVVYFGDEWGKLRAVDAKTGEVRWTFEAESSISAPPNLLPGDNGCLVVGSYDNSIYCVNLKDGTSRWKVPTEGHVHGSPAILDGKIIATGCDGFLRIIDGKSGKEASAIQAGSYIAASPAVDDGKLYVGTFDNEVIGVDVAKEEILWRYKHPKREFPFYSSPAVTRDTIILGGRDKMVHALDRKTGEARWTHSMRTRVDASPVVVGDRVYVADLTGVLKALSVSDGSVLWEFEGSDAFVGSPAVADGFMVIAAGDGTVYGFTGKDSSEKSGSEKKK